MMKSKTYVVPYKMGSQSAKALATALDTKRLNKERAERFVGGLHKTLINWGNSTIQLPQMLKSRILNKPEAVRIATNKLTFFTTVKDTGLTPKFFTSMGDVKDAFANGTKVIMARTVLTGHSGDGIVVMSSDDPSTWVEAPLYTEYVPKKDEYRVHVHRINNERKPVVFFSQRKAMVKGRENADFKIRNLQNGFIYANKDVEPPQVVLDAALSLFEHIDLDFGAVDIIYNEKKNTAYVLEVNTAPGLAGTTMEKYAGIFRL